jgi:hypothetical protein
MKGSNVCVAGGGLGVFYIAVCRPGQKIWANWIDGNIYSCKFLIGQAYHSIGQPRGIVEVSAYCPVAACLRDSQFDHFAWLPEYLPGFQDVCAVEIGSHLAHRLQNIAAKFIILLTFQTLYVVIERFKSY